MKGGKNRLTGERQKGKKPRLCFASELRDFCHVLVLWNDEMRCSGDGETKELQRGTTDRTRIALLSVCQVLYLLLLLFLSTTQLMLGALGDGASAG